MRTPDPLPEAARRRVLGVIDAYDAAFSRFRDDSLVAEMSRGPGTWELPESAAALFEVYRAVGALTEGAVSPLVGAALVHLGYGPGYRLTAEPGYLPAPAWEDVCAWEERRLRTSEPVTLDVGAAGKGQLADLVLQTLIDEVGSPAGAGVVVDAGGDIVRRGKPERIGLEDPADPRRVLGVVEVGDGAICGSSTNRRAWGSGLHHVVDARSGRPTTGVVATWATARDALTADAATTALFFASPARVARALGVGAFVLYEGGSAAWSDGGTTGRWEVFT